MSGLDFAFWALPLAHGAGGLLLWGLLVVGHAAEASLLAYPAARVQGAAARNERVGRALAGFAAQPQRVLLAAVVLQASALAGLLVLALHLGTRDAALAVGELTGSFAVVQGTLTALLLTLGARLLGQLLGRSLSPSVAAMAVPFLSVLGAALDAPLRLVLRAGAPIGLGPTVGPGPWHTVAEPNASPLMCGPFWTAEAVAEVTHAAHRDNMGERGPDLFASLATFSDTVIREVMVPRTDVRSIPLGASEAEVRAAMREAEHSRMPVYDDTIDHVVGLLHVKALLDAPRAGDAVGADGSAPRPFNLTALLRPTFFVPEVMKISALLREFQRRKTHMAIVVDEYGGTSGIVTLEDIIEEIVGEIHDEYDVEDKQFRVLPDGKILADAKANIWDLEQALGVPLYAEGEYETLGGFLLALLGSMPARGTHITYKDVSFTIKEANERRIRTVEVERRARG